MVPSSPSTETPTACASLTTSRVRATFSFVTRTGVDTLAVAIGTAHGIYPKGMQPELQMHILRVQEVGVFHIAGDIDFPDSERDRLGNFRIRIGGAAVQYQRIPTRRRRRILSLVPASIPWRWRLVPRTASIQKGCIDFPDSERDRLGNFRIRIGGAAVQYQRDRHSSGNIAQDVHTPTS
jgi:hypothetical protein